MKVNRFLIVLVCVLTLALIGLNSFMFYTFVNRSNTENTNAFIEISKEKDQTLQVTKDNSSKSKQENVKQSPDNNVKQPTTNKEPSKETNLYTCDMCSTKTEKVFFVDDYTLCVSCDANISDFFSPCVNCNQMKPNKEMYSNGFCKKCYEHNYDPPSQEISICDSCNKKTEDVVYVHGNCFCYPCEEKYWSNFVVCSICNAYVAKNEITSGGICINCSDKSNSEDTNNNVDKDNQSDNSDEVINE